MLESKTDTPKPPPEWTDELQGNLECILSVGEECISKPELKNVMLYCSGAGKRFNLYDGFEPSGRMHIAQGVFKAMNVNKCTRSGGHFIFWVADWFALMNDKMGGDLEKIKIVGQYLIEVWKAAGMNLDNVTFQWASEDITNQAHVYWPKMLDIARRFNVTRIKKCCQIMGRLEGSLKAAQALYPIMQCTDIFFLRADVCQLGVDQRKVNMLAREYCDAANIKRKPVILSHHMLYGLKAGQAKMSKSDPDSAVFMEDTEEDVHRKIMAAYCPRKKADVTENKTKASKGDGDYEVDAGKESMHLVDDELKNPCLDYVKNIIFSPPNATFTIPSNGTRFHSYEEVLQAFLSGGLSETELKDGLISELNRLLDPVRTHFTEDENARNLLAQVREFKRGAASEELCGRKELRRLNLVQLGKVEENCHVIFVPPPTSNPTLQSVTDVLTQIAAAGDNVPVVLYLSDWGGMVQNCLLSESKAINAYYDVFLAALNAMNIRNNGKTFTVLKQSESILLDPSMYWISVINTGRYFSLDDVMGDNMKDSDCVGKVIARLMKVADVLALSPASIAFTGTSTDDLMDCTLIQKYLEAIEFGLPKIVEKNASSLLLYKRESEAHRTPNDEYYITDDPKVNGKSKMKKAFCEPGNTSFCPPISIACTFGLGNGDNEDGINISRSEANGGNVTFKTVEAIKKAFADGSLHPGDLKAAASTIMVGVLDCISKALKANKDVVKSVKALKVIDKKMAKQKQKESK